MFEFYISFSGRIFSTASIRPSIPLLSISSKLPVPFVSRQHPEHYFFLQDRYKKAQAGFSARWFFFIQIILPKLIQIAFVLQSFFYFFS